MVNTPFNSVTELSVYFAMAETLGAVAGVAALGVPKSHSFALLPMKSSRPFVVPSPAKAARAAVDKVVPTLIIILALSMFCNGK
jgi:hypothetical protein